MKMMSLRQESCHVIIDVLVFKNHKHFNDIQIPYLISAVNDLLLKLNLHVTKPKETNHKRRQYGNTQMS